MSSHWNSSAPIGFSGRTMSETGKLGVNDLPLTADQLIKTFQILLRVSVFVFSLFFIKFNLFVFCIIG